MHSIPLGPSEKNSFCVKAQRKRDMCDPEGKNPILGPSEMLRKLICRSQLHAQRTKMHSIALGPSEKNSFCAKAKRRRDMCDP